MFDSDRGVSVDVKRTKEKRPDLEAQTIKDLVVVLSQGSWGCQ